MQQRRRCGKTPSGVVDIPTVGDVSLLQTDPRDALFRAHRTVHIGGCSVR